MPDIAKTADEILADEKQTLFDADIEESKARQRRVISQADYTIDYAHGQITKCEQSKSIAQKLLEELETRYPTPVVEEP